MLAVITVLAFLNISLLGYLLLSSFSSKRRIIDRLQNYLNPEKTREEPDKNRSIPWREGLKVVGKSLGKSKLGNKYAEKLEAQLVQAHIPLKAEEFAVIKAVLFLLTVLITYIFGGKLPTILLLAGLAFFIPDMYLNQRRKTMQHKIEQQLPDTIALISNSLKAGFSFLQAIDVASRELPPPVSLEFGHIMKEVNLGVNTESALEELGKRIHSEDLELVILAVLIQRQIGGNLSEILDNITETIRSRIKIKGEIRILTAQGRISGLIVSLLPVLLGAALFFINPEYIRLLFQNPMGWAMLGMAVLMQAVGIYSVSKIIKIEV